MDAHVDIGLSLREEYIKNHPVFKKANGAFNVLLNMLWPSDIIPKSDNTGAVILSVSVCLSGYMFMRMLLWVYKHTDIHMCMNT